MYHFRYANQISGIALYNDPVFNNYGLPMKLFPWKTIATSLLRHASWAPLTLVIGSITNRCSGKRARAPPSSRGESPGYKRAAGIEPTLVKASMSPLQLMVTWHRNTLLESKLRTGTSKTKRLHPVKFEFSLFWMSQYVAFSPAWWILYHVTINCKGPIVKGPVGVN